MNKKTLEILEFDKIKEELKKNTSSSLGAQLAQELCPSYEYDEVITLLKETDEAVKIIEKCGSSPIIKYNDVSAILGRIKLEAMLSMAELLSFASFLKAVRFARNGILDSNEENEDSLYDFARQLVPYKDIEQSIYNDIISEEEIADSASPKLNLLRKQIRKQNESIKDRLNSLVRSLDKEGVLQEGIITLRNDRYVLPVVAAHKGRVPGIVHDQSASGATLFIEPMAVVEINNTIRQLKLDERDEIIRILQEYSQSLFYEYKNLESNNNLLAKLDLIFAKAKLSREMDAITPQINKKGYVYIKEGRHPLIDKKAVVPINVWLGKEFTQLLITGPNTGGKTVSLKTIGLFSLMVQSGLNIPAEIGTQFPVFDNIFADIGDEQSIQQSLSTFSSHMKNIAEIMKNITTDSLVLFDELGAGTDPTEGAALALSILEELRKRRIRTVVTSHYAELKAYSLSHVGAENASVEFDVQSLKPTYKLMVGVPGNSNAFLISQKLGLDRYLIDRARSYVDDDKRKLDKVLLNAEEYRASAQAKKTEAQQIKNEIDIQKRKLDKEKQDIIKEREKMLLQASKEAQIIKENALKEVTKVIDELKDIQNSADPSAIFKARELKKKINVEEKEEKQELKKGEAIKNYVLGMDVYITSLDKEGTLVSIPNSKGKALVNVGIIQMEIDKKYLAVSKQKKENQLNSTLSVHRTNTNVPMSIDVRGQLADEAVANVDLYLDLAYGRNLGSVTIIHGKGTGALKNAIWQYLRQNKKVKSFRLGTYGEGDAGVTIVEFNG
ncbi:MAG: endonuclease MutS2 [Clostridiales bacterium]|nr:endonuclease MutS2 [Clostridiales bacterium]